MVDRSGREEIDRHGQDVAEMSTSAPFVYNIMLVSDHRIFRQGLRVLLERPADFHIVDDVDCKSALARIHELQPAIVLLDLKEPQVDTGLSLLAEIRQLRLDTRVIALLPRGVNSTLLVRAIRDGAKGYVPEDTGDIKMVEEAIRKVGQGHLYFSNTTLVTLLATISNNVPTETATSRNDPGGLSPREHAVLELVAQGYTNRQISVRLVISESTTRTHVHNILEKLNLENRVQAATYALKRPATLPKKTDRTPSQWSSIVDAGT